MTLYTLAIMATEKFHHLDALRGLASLAVCWFHLTLSEALPAWLRLSGAYGWLGVEVFFVISGWGRSRIRCIWCISRSAVSSLGAHGPCRLHGAGVARSGEGTVHRPLGSRVVNLGLRFATNPVQQTIVVVAALLASLASAQLLYVAVERPAQRWAGRIAYNQPDEARA